VTGLGKPAKDARPVGSVRRRAGISEDVLWVKACDHGFRGLLESWVADIQSSAGRGAGMLTGGAFADGLPRVTLDLAGCRGQGGPDAEALGGRTGLHIGATTLGTGFLVRLSTSWT